MPVVICLHIRLLCAKRLLTYLLTFLLTYVTCLLYFCAAEMHRVCPEGASTASLHSKVADPEEGLEDRDVADVRVRHLHPDPAQHFDAGDDGESAAELLVVDTNSVKR